MIKSIKQKYHRCYFDVISPLIDAIHQRMIETANIQRKMSLPSPDHLDVEFLPSFTADWSYFKSFFPDVTEFSFIVVTALLLDGVMPLLLNGVVVASLRRCGVVACWMLPVCRMDFGMKVFKHEQLISILTDLKKSTIVIS